MRKVILNLALAAGMVMAISSSYAQEPNKKSADAREDLNEAQKDVVEAKKDVVEAKSDLKEAQQDSVADYQKYKKDAELKIKSNEKRIAELNAEFLKMDANDRAANQKKVGELEQKNNNLKKKLAEAKYEGPDEWSLFKIDFNKEMDKLAKSLKDFTTNNKN